MSITIVHTLPEEEWRNYVLQHPEGNIFHTPEMFQVYSQTKGHRPEVWAATRDGRILAFFLPVQITLMDGLIRRFTTRSVAYGSVLCVPDEEGQEALALLLETYTHEVDGTLLFTELRNLSNLEPVQPILREHGLIYEDHLNYLIDINRSPQALFETFGRRTRKTIRRGLRRGDVLFEEAVDRKQLAACYDLLRQSYKKAQVPLADRSLFEAALEVLHPKGMARFTLARVGQIPVAVSIDLLYKDIMFGWYGGVDRLFGSYVPNELLTWHLLEWGAQNGYRLYDFGGAGKPDEDYGVRDFKSKFGGELVSFGRNICVHAPLSLLLSKLGYSVLRRFL